MGSFSELPQSWNKDDETMSLKPLHPRSVSLREMDTPSALRRSQATLNAMRFPTLLLSITFTVLFVGQRAASAEKPPGTVPTAIASQGPSLEGSVLRPASQVRAIKRGVELHVGEGATIQPTFTTSLPVGERGAKVPVQTVEVDGGRVDALFTDSGSPRGVLLQAPDKILGIATQGHMVMKVEPETVSIGALSGDVLVGHDSKFKPLPAGKVRVISRVTGISKDSPLPEAPVIENTTGLSVVLSGKTKVNLRRGADRPLLLSLIDEMGQTVVPAQRFDAGTPLSVDVPHAGVFYVVARSLGDGGIEGPLSRPERVQVLGLASGQRAPEGGVFLLGRGERVHLAGTDGLEVRYGSSPTYLPATNTVGLSQARRTAVEFRNPKDPSQRAVLVLAPRFMKREIELGPSEAHWPGQPVKIRVGLWDGAGKLLAPGHDVEVLVTVNSTDVSVPWRMTDDGFVGQVEKQRGEGPWVVRVHVVDPRGHTIARDFLEVSRR